MGSPRHRPERGAAPVVVLHGLSERGEFLGVDVRIGEKQHVSVTVAPIVSGPSTARSRDT